MEAALSLSQYCYNYTKHLSKMERGAITRINVTREKTRAAKYKESLYSKSMKLSKSRVGSKRGNSDVFFSSQ